MPFLSTIQEIVADLKNGKMCIVVDNADRENEGDILLPASFANPENINFIIKEARGILCLVMEQQDANRLGIQLLPKHNISKNAANFGMPIDATEKHGVSTGVSCYDRAKTVSVALNPNSSEKDFMSPGHLFTLIADQRGLRHRQGHTEASIELMRIADLPRMSLICEIIDENGHMMRKDSLILFAKKHNIKIVAIDEIINYLQKA